MQNQAATMDRSTGTDASPVDNATYNVLQTLTSRLEAIEAYGKYLADADEDTRSFFEACREADRKSANEAMELLKRRLASR